MRRTQRILLGLAAGALAGIAVNTAAADQAWVQPVLRYFAEPVGQIFLRLLMMTVVPVVFASLALGVAGMPDLRTAGKLGAATLLYFLLSTFAAAGLGVLLVDLLHPGSGLEPAIRDELLATYRQQTDGMQGGIPSRTGIALLTEAVPRNPVRSAADMDMLGIIVFSLFFGAALTRIPAELAQRMIRFLESLAEVMARIIDFAMAFAPLGVFGLMFAATARFGFALLQELGLYVLVVLGGLLLHAAVVLSAVVRFGAGMSPLAFWYRVRTSLVTAFSTSSSNATLPTNLLVAERELGIPAPVARFVLPLGATLNMNGTALYEGVTVLFLAEVFGIDLTLGQQLLVVILSVLTAMGAAGVPGASLPMMMVVLGMVGVPPAAIGVILGIDRLLDMSRTTLNVTGDLAAALVVARRVRGADPPGPGPSSSPLPEEVRA